MVVRWINPPAGLRPSPLRQGDAAFQGALQAAEPLKDLDRALENGLLDPGDLAADLRVELGRARFPSPVVEHRPGPVQLLPGPGDSHDLSILRPRSLSAFQRPRCTAPQEQSAVAVS